MNKENNMKEMLVESLKAHGFMDVWIDNGVVMVGVASEAEMKQVKNIIHDTKYNASWGMKIRNTSACN